MLKQYSQVNTEYPKSGTFHSHLHSGVDNHDLQVYKKILLKLYIQTEIISGIENVDIKSNTNNEFFEKEPTYLKPGIKVVNLRKVFGKNKTAVRDISLNMYENQITVLLGHNGAGKTTTMSMLTGILTPTSGTAIVGDHNIRTDMDQVRESLGLCPQHNIIFEELTVREHLYFFSKLKGMNHSEIEGEIQKYVELLELVPKVFIFQSKKNCCLQ